MKLCPELSREAFASALTAFDHARVALIGDLCLDMYLQVDMRLSALSRETPHFNLPVVGERFSPGGAANTAANIAALKPASVTVLGAIGKDWRAGALLGALRECGVDTRHVLQSEKLTTNTYLKVLRSGISDVVYEDPRIDFENRVPVPDEISDALSAKLDEIDFDVLMVIDQMECGCVTEKVREKICALAERGRMVMVDSRDRIGLYRHCIVKPNEVEAARAFGSGTVEGDICPFAEDVLPKIVARNHAPAIVTLGDKGSMYCDGGEVLYCPARAVRPPVDIVGAGDTFMSAAGTALAAGLAPEIALRMAAAASSITIKKIGTTGTASREELLAALN